jgi:tetratricopeptide (TPR) repeat protein
MSLPLDSARQVGLYYRALASQRNALLDEAQILFETVADHAPSTYRARALQSLGTNHHTRRHLDEALRFQLEALRVASDKDPHDLQTTLLAYLQISHIKSDNGDHNGALAVLDGISPLVEIVSQQSPHYFYLYHNELAVEFGELNLITSAEAASAIALTSPFASAYPEWAETRQELAAKRTSATPSVVPVRQTAEGIPASRTEPQHCQKPDRVLAFCRLIIQGTAFQRTLILIAGFKAVADRPIRIDILDQLGRSFRARAPPPQH